MRKWFLLLVILMMGGGAQGEGRIFEFEDRLRVYLPSGSTVIRGLLFCGNGAGADNRGEAQDAALQEWVAKHDFGIVATNGFGNFGTATSFQTFLHGLEEIAGQSGHPELRNVPFLWWGHSNGGQMAYAAARHIPERSLAFIVNKGGNYATKVGRGEPVQVPALFFAGSRDEERRQLAIQNLYREGRNRGALWAWVVEHGEGHGAGNAREMALAFFEEILALRYPPDPRNVPSALRGPALRPLRPERGWLVEEGPEAWSGGYVRIGPAALFQGTPLALGWVPSEQIAVLYRAMASYDPRLRGGFKGKAVRFLEPHDPAASFRERQAGREMINAGQPVTVTLEVAIPEDRWSHLALYDGTTLLRTIRTAPDNRVTVSLELDAERPSHALHAELLLPDGARRTSHVLWLVSRPAEEIQILRQPEHARANPEGVVKLAVEARGTEPITYQWYHNGIAREGATGPILYLVDLGEEDYGDYSVELVNPLGSMRSTVAEVRPGEGESLVARINFQPPGTPLPGGWLMDSGARFTHRGNGLYYGWEDHPGSTRQRLHPESPDLRRDTLLHTNGRRWKMAVPPGEYRVRLIAGDPAYTDQRQRFLINGTLAIDLLTTPRMRWGEGEEIVAAPDGFIFIEEGDDVTAGKLCFVEIHAITRAAQTGEREAE